MDNNFESKHTVRGASGDLAKSLVMLNRKIVWLHPEQETQRELSKH